MVNALTKIFKRVTSFAIDWNNTDGTVGGGGIDAIDQPKKRRNPTGRTTSLDDEIKDRKRSRISLTARNVRTNFEVAAWAIRKHLDFVSSFTFSMRTKDEAFNKQVEDFVKWWSRPLNFDAAGKYGLSKSIRIAEGSRCVDGDVAFMKLSSGRVQAIEGDRIKTPDTRAEHTFDADFTYNGVEVSRGNGRPKRYAVHSRRRGGGMEFERWIPTRNIFLHGFFERFDQYRGHSPVVASLNRLEDVYENFDYALQRAKVSQLFGLSFERDKIEGETDQQFGQVTGEDIDGDGKDDRFDVKLTGRPMILDNVPGEKASFLENKTPAPEFQTFTNTMIGVSLKSLDIPFSFFDEAYTNFFGSKAALTLYLQSAREKRSDVQELKRKLTIWRLQLAIEDGDIILPRFVQTMDDILFEWVPSGIPWYDPRDVRGDIDKVNAGFSTREDVCRDHLGKSFMRDIAPQLQREQELIAELGINVTLEAPPVQVVSVDEVNEQNEERSQNENVTT